MHHERAVQWSARSELTSKLETLPLKSKSIWAKIPTMPITCTKFLDLAPTITIITKLRASFLLLLLSNMSGSSSNQLPSCNNHGGDTNTTPIAAFIAIAEKKKRPTSNDTSTLNSELRPKSANDEAATAAKANEGEDTNKRACTERAKHGVGKNSEVPAEWTCVGMARSQGTACREGTACRHAHGQGNPTSNSSDRNAGNGWACGKCTFVNTPTSVVS